MSPMAPKVPRAHPIPWNTDIESLTCVALYSKNTFCVVMVVVVCVIVHQEEVLMQSNASGSQMCVITGIKNQSLKCSK